ncbi:hypothetical protein [Agrobacterium vitis]|uniref:hypothetical protein n=1 Tax=Agrobacterium vitis TaxID=373 RepID=UPI0008721579|nr:hypothetical protein [Agrobacterium vitis]MCE6074720.1 hypothetical protein [Agrobacterium vitis]MCM2450885.1 hypothetical protein [Agrobacterium vitis]MCM2467875.1 hypothetical protein [Agrobacterium vitis]MUO68220.1 hypothetical protein [Agrobacterium vitis]MUO83562.1 hypothetical protein [Agrobacterium vitis]
MAPVYRIIFALAAAALSALFAAVSIMAAEPFTPRDPGFLGDGDAARIVEKVGDLEKALGDEAVLAGHFAGLVSPPEETASLHQLTGNVPGLVYVLPVAHDEVRGTLIDMRFTGKAAADGFRQKLDQTFGPSDPACSDDIHAYWAVHKDRSLALRVDVYETEATAQLTLFASAPPDANCKINSAPPNALLDKVALTALLARLKTEPPPWSDADAMEAWLKSYGEVAVEKPDTCSAQLDIAKPRQQLGGIGTFSASLRLCPVSRFGKPSSLFLYAGENDLFGFRKTEQSLEAALGPRHVQCSGEGREVWVVSPEMTAVLSRLYPSFGVLIVNAPVTALADCRE